MGFQWGVPWFFFLFFLFRCPPDILAVKKDCINIYVCLLYKFTHKWHTQNQSIIYSKFIKLLHKYYAQQRGRKTLMVGSTTSLLKGSSAVAKVIYPSSWREVFLSLCRYSCATEMVRSWSKLFFVWVGESIHFDYQERLHHILFFYKMMSLQGNDGRIWT